MDKRRVNVRGIVWRDGKILAVKHRNDDGSEVDHWAIPGGGLDPMESLQDGVKREIYEELGVRAQPGKLLFMQQFRSKRDNFDEELELFFHIHDDPGFDSVDLKATSHGLNELVRVEFIDPSKHLVLPRILNTLDIGAIITADTELHVVNELDADD